MATNRPSSVTEVIQRILADLRSALEKFKGNPFLVLSWLQTFAISFATRAWDFYGDLERAEAEQFADTAEDNLERIGRIWGIRRSPGSQATGLVIATGVLGAPIPVDAVLLSGDGGEYTAQFSASVLTRSLPVTSIVLSGTTATLTTDEPHNLTDSVPVTITGAIESEYNVVGAEITVIGAAVFEYQVSGSPSSPATGTPLVGAETAEIFVRSVEFADVRNTLSLATLSFENRPENIDADPQTTFDGLGGATDIETLDALRFRILDRIQNPVANFNVSAIRTQVLSVPGVTRVQVLPITPEIGQVTVYFMRDLDDTGPIPSAGEVSTVKTALLEILPANTSEDDLFVLAPIGVPTDFNFNSITPDTPTMRTAVKAQLEEFFKTEPEVGEPVTSDQYRTAIQTTVDVETGAEISSFDLQLPVGPLPISVGEISILGEITGI